jgi:hypothetical protein
MKTYNNIIVFYPMDETIDFLQPIKVELEKLFPSARVIRPVAGMKTDYISDETDLVIFLGHGSPSRLYGGATPEGEKSVFLDISNGSRMLDEVDVILFSCNSAEYCKTIKHNAKIDCYVTFGDMPTDWEHILHKRQNDVNFLIDFTDEHLEYYKSTIVEAVIEGLKNGFRTNSFIGISKRISFVVNQKINMVIFNQNWSKRQKIQLVGLLNDFKKDIRFAQSL